MDLVITICMNNAVFENGRDYELERLFAKVRDLIGLGIGEGRNVLRDSKGNNVGAWEIKK